MFRSRTTTATCCTPSQFEAMTSSSSEKHVACIGPMDRRVAHGARLIFGGLIVGRSRRSLSRKCVTLQTQQLHLAYAQATWIGRSGGRVTTAAALRLHRHIFVDRWALRVSMALDA